MYFYTITTIVFFYTLFFFITRKYLNKLISNVSKELSIPETQELSHEQKRLEFDSLKEMREFISDRTIEGWFCTRFIYGMGFILYLIIPLLGFSDHVGFKTEIPISSYLLNLTLNSSIENSLTSDKAEILKIWSWAGMSAVYGIGMLTARSISIQRLRLKYCTGKQRENWI